jgi:hopanoid biosynthesis associated protein HpnK
MVAEPAAADAVARARRLPTLKVGLHVVLVEGIPVSPPETIPDLVDGDGRFPSDMVRAGFRFFFKPGVRRQLAREIRAQFEAFAATGLALDHVNTHKHIHLHPTVARLIVEIGRGFGLRSMRVPNEPYLGPGGLNELALRPWLGGLALRAWTCQLRWFLHRAGIATNDHVIGLAWSGAMTEARVLELLPRLPDGVTELYFHPATGLTPGLARTMPTYRHADELAALLSPAVRRAIERLGVPVTSFSALVPSTGAPS